MKKIVSLLFVFSVILVSVFSTSATGKIYNDIPYKTDTLYLDKIIEYNEHYREDDYYYSYHEFCHYSDENNEEPDWVLMVCSILPPPWVRRHGALVGNRALYTSAGPGFTNSDTGLLVYIPKTDTFIDLVNSNMEQITELCPDFVEVIEENKIGRELGDVNDDNSLDILDATHIQLALAKNESFPVWGVWSGEEVFSMGDVDCDGEFTVLDATAIQMKLAQLN